jgi:tripartite-type tricarboxylate transporter receptor subunit TctC
MRQLFATLLAGAILIVPVVSRAQLTTDYPNRPIRLIVGFAPGGATDTLARLLTGALGQELGQAIYVENIAGASGYIAWRNVAALHAGWLHAADGGERNRDSVRLQGYDADFRSR